MYDAAVCDVAALSDAKSVESTLMRVVEAIDMTAITEPRTLTYDGGSKPEDSGITTRIDGGPGQVFSEVIIAESHVFIHTFPAKRFVMVDIASCKSFAHANVRQILNDYFKPQSVEFSIKTRMVDRLIGGLPERLFAKA